MSVICIEAVLSTSLACAQVMRDHIALEYFDAMAAHAELVDAAEAPLMLQFDAASAAQAAGSEQADMGALAIWVSQQVPARLAAVERVRYLKAAIRVSAWVESRINDAMLAIAGSTRRVQSVQVAGARGMESLEIEDAARSEIALAARWTESYAQERLTAARMIRLLLPETEHALELGALSATQAMVIAEGAQRLAVGLGVDASSANVDRKAPAWLQLEECAAALDHRASAIAARSTRSHTRAAVNRIVDALDPDGMRRRRQAASRQRGVWVQPEADGNSLLIARMGVAEANACMARVRALAEDRRTSAVATGSTDARGIGELRAEALADLILHSATTEVGAATPRARADIDVVITLDALLRLQGSATPDTAFLQSGDGEDLLPAEEVRDLFADGHEVTLRRLVTDPITGHLLDVSPRRYTPSDRLREFIASRDLRCRWPGCNARAATADLDHAHAFEQGGASSRANLGLLCRRHHLLKTHAGYDIEAGNADGSCRFTTPSGLQYQHDPRAVVPDTPPW